MSTPRKLPAVVLMVLSLAANALGARAANWPTYNKDNAHSAVTTETLRLPLSKAWTFRSRKRPRPAWDEPATWDGWHKIYDLKNRQVFDKAFHVAVVDGSVYFGSSVDDKVYCLDTQTGAVRWVFYTEGPVRLAPSVVNGRVYVGSDDGFVYCLDADKGSLVWKHRPGPSSRRVPGNGRMVSVWAVRTGIVILDGTAYCCAGVVPYETVYLSAINADSGEPVWQTPIKDLPAQGYMLASSTRLYVTTGRNRPLVFDRASGERLFQVQGSSTGGTYALLTGDTLVYGPGKTGQVAVIGPKQKDQLASFGGNHMIVTPDMSYLHSDTDLSALDRRKYLELNKQRAALSGEKTRMEAQIKKAQGDEADPLKKKVGALSIQIDELAQAMQDCYIWKVGCDEQLSLILAGETLFAGGSGKVIACSARSGQTTWSTSLAGNAFGLAAAGGQLFVSTDEGAIHCFTSNKRTAQRSENERQN